MRESSKLAANWAGRRAGGSGSGLNNLFDEISKGGACFR